MNTMASDEIKELRKRLIEISHFSQAVGLMHWDKEVNMPPKAIDPRSKAIVYLGSLAHSKFIAIDADGLLSDLMKKLDSKKITGKDAALVKEVWRSFDRERKLPENFVLEMIEVTSKAQNIWVEAREKNSFSLFLPWLSPSSQV